MKINKYEEECDDINRISKKGEKNFLHISFDFLLCSKVFKTFGALREISLRRVQGDWVNVNGFMNM